MSGGDGCQFCLKYGRPEEECRTHRLRTASGLVSCPILRNLTCPICQATGDFAHTRSYCPLVSVEGATTMKNKKLPREPAPRPWPLSSYQNLMKNYTGTIGSLPPPPPSSVGLQTTKALYQQQEPTSPLLAQHQQYLQYYREKWMEHQAEINRLRALRKLKCQVSQPPPSLNTIYYRTFKPPAITTPDAPGETKQQRHFFPDSMQLGAAMMMVDNPELGIELAKLREGTVEVKMN